MVAQGRFGVNRICCLTGISKASYYAAKDPADSFEAKYLKLKALVEKVIEHHPAYGIKRIKAELEAAGNLRVGRDTLAKLLNLWGVGIKEKG